MKRLATLLSCALAAPALAQERPMEWTGVLDEEAFAALHELKEGAAPPLLGEEVALEGGRAYLSRAPGGDALGAVIVIHEWWGLNDHVRHWTDRLAADGYDALAVDLYGGTVATTREEAMAAMRGVDEARALATLRAAHAWAASEEGLGAARTASIGWCFGGGWSLRLAMAEPDLDAAVVYYGRLVDDAEALAGIRADVLGVFGNQDGGIPPAAVDAFAAAMETAGRSLELRRYDANHAFANPSSARYDASSAARAWRETRAFLASRLWPPSPEGSVAKGTRELAFEVPQGWKATGAGPIRLQTFWVPGDGDAYIGVETGPRGDRSPTVDNARRRVGLEPLSPEEEGALPHVLVLGQLAPIVYAEGALKRAFEDPLPGQAILFTVVELEGERVFVQLTGERDVVERERAAFVQLCRSLR